MTTISIRISTLQKSTKRQIALVLFLCLLALGAAAKGASSDVLGWEQAIALGFYEATALFLPLVLLVTQLGSVWFAAAVIVWLFLRQRLDAVMLFGAVVLSFVTSEAIKAMVARPRPYNTIDGILHKDPLTVGGFGFPSGHAAIAAALGIGLAALFPSLPRWALGVLVLLVGISRIGLGMHLPLDVVGGAAIGVFYGALIFGPKVLADRQKKA